MPLSLRAAVAVTGVLAAQASWLDEPPRPWGGVRPVMPLAGEASWAGRDACLGEPSDGQEMAQVRRAGWRAFNLGDRAVARGDIVVLAGLRSLTADCAAVDFQVFVFAGGRFAGTLSPALMTTGKDGVVGTVRVLSGDTLTAEFARYAERDSECCPSGRIRVSYRLDRRGPVPRLLAVDRKVLREPNTR